MFQNLANSHPSVPSRPSSNVQMPELDCKPSAPENGGLQVGPRVRPTNNYYAMTSSPGRRQSANLGPLPQIYSSAVIRTDTQRFRKHATATGDSISGPFHCGNQKTYR